MSTKTCYQTDAGNQILKKSFLPVTGPFAALGRSAISWANHMGAGVVFFSRSVAMIFRPKQAAAIVQQVNAIGAKSTGIVILVGLFTGMVLGLQLYYTLVKVGSAGALGTVVALAVIRELGPVLAAIMITARAGSAMTAEIGTQRISEQIDALHSMRIDPIRYLVSPRIAAAVVSFPLLTALFDLVAIAGGYFSAVMMLGLNSGTYMDGVRSSVELPDIGGGIVKALVFALIVTTVCCFQGYFSHLRTDTHGGRSVGAATTSAVVLACVLILVADYVVTALV